MEERSSLRRDSVKIHGGWSLVRDKGWKKETLAVARFLHHENDNKIMAIRVLRLVTDHF